MEKEDEEMSYIQGKGYVGRKKKLKPAAPAPDPYQGTAPAGMDTTASPLQSVLTKVFGTVPRNKLKEAGLE